MIIRPLNCQAYVLILLVIAACGAPAEQTAGEEEDAIESEPISSDPTTIPSPLPDVTSSPIPTPIAPPSLTALPSLGAAICPTGGGQSQDILFDFDNFESEADQVSGQIVDFLNATPDGNLLLNALLESSIPEESEVYAKYQNTTAEVFVQDVTGDGQEEIIVNFGIHGELTRIIGNGHRSYVFVFTCSDGKYLEILSKELGAFYGPPITIDDEGIFFVGDMNGDGVSEIVVSQTHEWNRELSPASYVRLFQIVSWSEDSFQDLIPKEIDFLNSGTLVNGTGRVVDSDANGTLELILTRDYTLWNSEMGRKSTDTWMWNGSHFEISTTENSPPTLVVHAVWDGDAATLSGQPDKALAFYQQAVFDTELKPLSFYLGVGEERSHLEAYARYRIMLHHVADGNLDAAQIVYDTLKEKFPPTETGYAYAEMANIFWDSYAQNNDVAIGCEAAQEYAATNPFDVLHPLADYYQFFDNYSPEDICPFTELPNS